MPAIDDIKVVITADDKASGILSKFGNSVGGVSGALAGMAKIATGAVVSGFTALGAAAAWSIAQFDEADKATKQLEAVLQSTAGVAGMTKDAVLELSATLQKETTYADESVTSAQNMLLTFTKIGKDIFPQATRTVLDMSTALGQDLKSSAIQLGKALNDPIEGVTALKRVGVSFNDTQMETIKNLVESGKQLEAQKLILQELNTEFGGSAAAAAGTFSGKMEQLKNAVGDLGESIGGTLVPVIMPFIEKLTAWAQTPDAQAKMQEIAKSIAEAAREMKPVIEVLLPALIQLFGFAVKAGSALAKFFFVDLADAIGTVIFKVWEVIDAIAKFIEKIENAIKKIKEFMSNVTGGVLGAIGGAASGVYNNVKGFLGFAQGGIVPGPVGMPVPAIVHGGETVIPVGGGSGGMVINITGTFLSEDAAERMGEIIMDKLKLNLRI